MSNLPYEETHKTHISPGMAPQRARRTRWIKGIAWTSVFAGVVVALGVQMLLTMLGTGIGMSTIDPLHVGGTPSAAAFSIGAGLWWVVSSFIALLIGGWVAAQFSGYLRHIDGLLHGLLVWALATLITIYLLGSAINAVVSGAGTIMGAEARGMAETASTVVDWSDIKQDARTLLSRQQIVMDPEFNLALERFLTTNDPVIKETNRTALINLLMARTGMGIDDATNRVNRWERNYELAELKARQAADNAAKAVAWSALWGFIVILVSAIAAALGGFVGTLVPDIEIRGKG